MANIYSGFLRSILLNTLKREIALTPLTITLHHCPGVGSEAQ